jgi:hypothetical protein
MKFWCQKITKLKRNYKAERFVIFGAKISAKNVDEIDGKCAMMLNYFGSVIQCHKFVLVLCSYFSIRLKILANALAASKMTRGSKVTQSDHLTSIV